MLNKRRVELKSKLRNRERVFGAWTSLAHPSITEMFTHSGVDFVGIDIEHSTINQGESQRIIAASQAGGSLCLPRIASHNMEMVKRLLDSGADGIIVPMISTTEGVEKIISWIKYPPVGNRSYGIARGQGYGVDFEKYTNEWNDISSIIVQIESKEGIENIDKILSYDEIDGAMIGPYDLSGSLGIPGQIDSPIIAEAVKKVINACNRHGKACGTQDIAPDKESVEKAFKTGYTFIVLASDIFILWKWSQKMRDLLKNLR